MIYIILMNEDYQLRPPPIYLPTAKLLPTQFYELLVTYQMTDILDGFWRLVAHGGNVTLTSSEPNDITRS